MTGPSLQLQLTLEHRDTVKSRLLAYFQERLGVRVSSRDLHYQFGSSVRTRISEINRGFANITIQNEYYFDAEADKELSYYWSVPR